MGVHGLRAGPGVLSTKKRGRILEVSGPWAEGPALADMGMGSGPRLWGYSSQGPSGCRETQKQQEQLGPEPPEPPTQPCPVSPQGPLERSGGVQCGPGDTGWGPEPLEACSVTQEVAVTPGPQTNPLPLSSVTGAGDKGVPLASLHSRPMGAEGLGPRPGLGQDPPRAVSDSTLSGSVGTGELMLAPMGANQDQVGRLTRSQK